MVYRVIGLMSGSSLDGLDIVYTQLQEIAGKWKYEIVCVACYKYPVEWVDKLKGATALSAFEYQSLHTEYGHFIGQQINRFIGENDLHYKVQLIASHGHTTFHVPAKKMTAQLGDGAAIASVTGINVISDLRAMDMAFGGQGAPIVPIGEKLLLDNYDLFLNLGGIANLSYSKIDQYIAFDVCPANRVLNMLANEEGKDFDDKGAMAATGSVNLLLLEKLNRLEYYSLPYPKSLANDFGINVVYPIILDSGCTIPDGLRTCVEHVALQIKKAIEAVFPNRSQSSADKPQTTNYKLLATGGGVYNAFLIQRLQDLLQPLQIELVIPDTDLINYKEALIMALIGVLRWREENNVLASVTGASRDSIGGAVWIGENR